MQKRACLKKLEITDIQLPVVISKKVYDQIRYLCKEISAVEWSGSLFYRVEGSIKKPEEMKIILESILPMNKGSKAYTEYTTDSRVSMHWAKLGFDHKIGLIHSHNNMGK